VKVREAAWWAVVHAPELQEKEKIMKEGANVK